MSFAAVQKHVAVLERASLVTKEKRGREQIVRAHHDGLQRVDGCSMSTKRSGGSGLTGSQTFSQRDRERSVMTVISSQKTPKP